MRDLALRLYLRLSLGGERGASLLEYGVILVLVSVLSIAVLMIIGFKADNMLNSVSNTM